MNSENIVEILDSGDVRFAGRVISSAEFLVGTVLCGLKNDSGEVVEDLVEVDSPVSELSDDCNSSNSIIASVRIPRAIVSQPTRKRKHEKVTHLPQDDPRLSYAGQYFDAINNTDVFAFESMLKKIAIPKVVMLSRKNTPDPEFVVPSHMEMVGIEAITQMISHFFMAIPDIVVKQMSERIDIFANGESCIQCNLIVSGSKVLEIKGVEEGSDDKVVLKSEMTELINQVKGLEVSTTTSKVVVNVEVDGKSTRKVPLGIGAAQQRKNFCTPYTLAMHLNVQKKVFLIIFATD